MDHALIKKTIQSVFGQRAAQAQYSYRDVLQTFCSNSLSGGCFLEDINHLRTVTPSESIKYSSSDVVSDVMGHLTEFDSSGSTDKHDLYFNRQSNELLIRLYKQFHYKDTDQLNILDQDHTLIEHQKSDARPSYKGSGYWCNVMAVGDQPVYISLQGGNSTPRSELPTVLKRGFEQLSDQDLTFDCYRADGASYSENVLEVVDEYFDDFLVRSRISQKRIESVSQRGGFKTCVLNNNKSVQVAELNDQFANIDCRRILYRYRPEPNSNKTCGEPSDRSSHWDTDGEPVRINDLDKARLMILLGYLQWDKCRIFGSIIIGRGSVVGLPEPVSQCGQGNAVSFGIIRLSQPRSSEVLDHRFPPPAQC